MAWYYALALVIVGAIVFLLSLSLYLRREALVTSAKRLFLASIIFNAALWFKPLRGHGLLAFIVGWALAVISDVVFFRPKSRSIPNEFREQAIRRFENKTGEQYDSSFHDLDHTVPFAKGGNNTADNIRVVDRRANRSKGAKSPWWDVLGHIQGNSENPFQLRKDRLSMREQIGRSNPQTRTEVGSSGNDSSIQSKGEERATQPGNG